ncbi:hypothetical protein M422DRAFT_248835 [Sphaerobolus stellatus SS14]|nr:hypothetical protein M422DRAFT_248835 [Sphaerobolus stellatus SS14]
MSKEVAQQFSIAKDLEHAANTAAGSSERSSALVPPYEEEWRSAPTVTAVTTVNERVDDYMNVVAREGNENDRAAVIEGVAAAIENVGDTQQDEKSKKYWKKQGKKFRSSKDHGERMSILEECARGAMVVLTSPFAILGGVMTFTGSFFSLVGKSFTSVGKLSWKMSVRPTMTKSDN